MAKTKSNHMQKYASVINTDSLIKAMELVKTSELKPPCNALVSNLENLSSTVLLPISLVYNTTQQNDFWERFKKALAEGEVQGSKEEQRIEIERRMKALDNKDHFEWSIGILDDLIANQEIGIANGISGLFNMSLAFLWSIFETFAVDIWVTAVNSRSTTIGRTVVEDRKEYLMKSIYNLVINSDFEISIRDTIGNIASTAYDFTSIKGISKAYGVAFTIEKSKLNSIFQKTELLAISALRNVTIHNSGIIDEAYCKMLNDFTKLGSKVKLTGHELEAYANTIISIAVDIIQTIDEVLQHETNS